MYLASASRGTISLKEGAPLRTAIIKGTKEPSDHANLQHHIPGFATLILKRAIQAQFVLPFGASLGIGILLTTAPQMVAVPALYAIHRQIPVTEQCARKPVKCCCNLIDLDY